jgi:hypothetical protein
MSLADPAGAIAVRADIFEHSQLQQKGPKPPGGGLGHSEGVYRMCRDGIAVAADGALIAVARSGSYFTRAQVLPACVNRTKVQLSCNCSQPFSIARALNSMRLRPSWTISRALAISTSLRAGGGSAGPQVHCRTGLFLERLRFGCPDDR